ncbi:hypothetical protein B0H17DRAFT_1187842 [Mycena rosella]|uniref:Uncharacterized protein n=1 Tax=Mycena rosella TaxID=1033263 RepID=A0AAD7BSW9_MYCRO|nr:hypothetical protein B0H17DRAFT_1187842 [Mycena rosella]
MSVQCNCGDSEAAIINEPCTYEIIPSIRRGGPGANGVHAQTRSRAGGRNGIGHAAAAVLSGIKAAKSRRGRRGGKGELNQVYQEEEREKKDEREGDCSIHYSLCQPLFLAQFCTPEVPEAQKFQTIKYGFGGLMQEIKPMSDGDDCPNELSPGE